MADVRRRQRLAAAEARMSAWEPEPAGETLGDMGLTADELVIVARFVELLEAPDADQDEVARAAQRAACVLAREPGLTDHLARIEPT